METEKDLTSSVTDQSETFIVSMDGISQKNSDAEFASKLHTVAKIVYPFIGAIFLDNFSLRIANNLDVTDLTKMNIFFLSSVAGMMTGFIAASKMADNQ